MKYEVRINFFIFSLLTLYLGLFCRQSSNGMVPEYRVACAKNQDSEEISSP